MIEFLSENNFELTRQEARLKWIQEAIRNEGCSEGEISFIFCSDSFLHSLNVEFLQHDTLTDIITFDNSLGSELHGEIYISTDRVRENATVYNVLFEDELSRVLIHGILHLCGYKDKTVEEEREMRDKENHYLGAI